MEQPQRSTADEHPPMPELSQMQYRSDDGLNVDINASSDTSSNDERADDGEKDLRNRAQSLSMLNTRSVYQGNGDMPVPPTKVSKPPLGPTWDKDGYYHDNPSLVPQWQLISDPDDEQFTYLNEGISHLVTKFFDQAGENDEIPDSFMVRTIPSQKSSSVKGLTIQSPVAASEQDWEWKCQTEFLSGTTITSILDKTGAQRSFDEYKKAYVERTQSMWDNGTLDIDAPNKGRPKSDIASMTFTRREPSSAEQKDLETETSV